MMNLQVARRNARLLVNTVDISDVPSVIEELKAFSRILDSNRMLRILFISPIFSEEEKEKALDSIISHMKAKEETRRFLKLLITQAGLQSIKDIINLAIILYHERMNRMIAEVSTAVPISERHIDKLKHTLRSLTKRDIEIDLKIDPSLIGGFIIKVGSTIYDSSLKGQLMLLRAELTK